ncbi:hypothetical protein Rhopal_004148-T1 [Rhodotorula paludigena]|uniref:MARVEL domain-containing protein n=1 Tax=Rhodotorula paludigena TaxID=86838 RepID=A0AAV5GF15_9BASI|nr:hypothetical protein Rhopal_004148-T1 [Rhodotorula paludigena]
MYLRIPRVTVFALTTALCITEIGLAAWTLADSHDKQDRVKNTVPGARLNLDDAQNVGKAVTAASAVSAALCIGMLIWTLVRPRASETLTSIRIKEGMFLFASLFFLGSLIPATYYTATRSGVITAPVPQSLIDAFVRASGEDLRYRKSNTILSYLCTGWVAFLFLLISFVLVSIAARKTLKYGADRTGPLDSTHEKHAGAAATPTGATTEGTRSFDESRPSVTMQEKGPGALHSNQV